MTARLMPHIRCATAQESAVTPQLRWLGQAGFLLRLRGRSAGVLQTHTVVIDPYLSDSLAGKYAGTHFSHERLMAAPIQPASLSDVDLVLCTHRHTDHMDPETLRAIASANHDCVFVVPQAWREHAIGFGLPGDRVLGADAALSLEPLPGLVVTPVLAAHEGLEFDEFGHSRHLGYVLGSEGIRVYHSGDCVPFANQADQLRGLGIQIALLPVNGRDADRLAHGVPGNFHPAEAIALAAAIGAQTILGHHFGMFAFNTVHEPHLADALRDLPDALQWVRPQLSRPYWIVHA